MVDTTRTSHHLATIDMNAAPHPTPSSTSSPLPDALRAKYEGYKLGWATADHCASAAHPSPPQVRGMLLGTECSEDTKRCVRETFRDFWAGVLARRPLDKLFRSAAAALHPDRHVSAPESDVELLRAAFHHADACKEQVRTDSLPTDSAWRRPAFPHTWDWTQVSKSAHQAASKFSTKVFSQMEAQIRLQEQQRRARAAQQWRRQQAERSEARAAQQRREHEAAAQSNAARASPFSEGEARGCGGPVGGSRVAQSRKGRRARRMPTPYAAPPHGPDVEEVRRHANDARTQRRLRRAALSAGA